MDITISLNPDAIQVPTIERIRRDYSAILHKMKSSLIQCPDGGGASLVFRGILQKSFADRL